MLELEKNLIVHRLADGRRQAHDKATSKVRNAKRNGKLVPGMLKQDGSARSVGAKSWLAEYGKPTRLQQRHLHDAIKAQSR